MGEENEGGGGKVVPVFLADDEADLGGFWWEHGMDPGAGWKQICLSRRFTGWLLIGLLIIVIGSVWWVAVYRSRFPDPSTFSSDDIEAMVATDRLRISPERALFVDRESSSVIFYGNVEGAFGGEAIHVPSVMSQKLYKEAFPDKYGTAIHALVGGRDVWAFALADSPERWQAARETFFQAYRDSLDHARRRQPSQSSVK